jgi:ankyrin repeat protein
MESTSHLALTLFSRDNPAYLTWIQLSAINVPGTVSFGSKRLKRTLTPLYYAAQLGLRTIVRVLLDAGADVNEHGGEYGSALHAASTHGYEDIVKILLDSGANINAPGGDYGSTALETAAGGGHEQMVKIRIDRGAVVNDDINAHGEKSGIRAVHAALEMGHANIVKILN